MRRIYTIALTREQLDTIGEGLCELPAKKVLHLIAYLHESIAKQEREAAEEPPPQ